MKTTIEKSEGKVLVTLEGHLDSYVADEVAEKLAGIPCRGDTSCPDQLSRAIRAYHD